VKVRPGGRRWIVVGLAVAAVVLAATVVLLDGMEVGLGPRHM
jgi:hypothetical protein